MAKIILTKLEAAALYSTAGQMEDDMEHYNFLPKREYENFVAAYKSGREKLRIAAYQKRTTKNKN